MTDSIAVVRESFSFTYAGSYSLSAVVPFIQGYLYQMSKVPLMQESYLYQRFRVPLIQGYPLSEQLHHLYQDNFHSIIKGKSHTPLLMCQGCHLL